MTYEKPKYASDNGTWRGSGPEFRRYLEVKAKYSDYLFSLPGVSEVGARFRVGARPPSIVVSVDIDRPPEQRDVVDKIPREPDGCVVEIQEGKRPELVG